MSRAQSSSKVKSNIKSLRQPRGRFKTDVYNADLLGVGRNKTTAYSTKRNSNTNSQQTRQAQVKK